MQYMKRLKIIFQSNIFYYVLIFITILYVLIFTNINNNNILLSNQFVGVVSDVLNNDNYVSLVIKGKEKVKGYYYKSENDSNDYYKFLGKKIRIIGEVKNATNNTIPNTFNYKDYLKKNGILGSYNIESIEIIDDENFLSRLKYLIIKRINSYDNKIIPYLNVFILGDKSILDDSILKSYQTNGIIHLFSISGMHIGLIILIFSFILKNNKYKKILISIFLLFFMFLTDFSPSVERACIFYFLKNLFEYFDFQVTNIKILLIVAFIIILLNPFVVYNNGFKYSFIITLSIFIESKSIKGNYFFKIFKISLLAFLVSLPITININYEINLLSLLLNVFYVPFISVVVFPLCVITFFLKFLSPILIFILNILETTNELFNNYKMSIIIPKMSLLIIIIYYTLIFIYFKTKKKYSLFLILIVLVINYLLPKLDNSFRLYYLDVSQGDSNLFLSPHQKEIILIDTGGNQFSNNKISDNIMLFLKSMGIGKIHSLILTHGDYDHMGEAINLVNNFKVEKVIFNCGEFNDLEKELIKVLDKKKIKYYSCIKELNIDNNKLYFLQTKEYDNENDNSNVIYTELNGYKFMFMGDAGVTTEKEILDKYNLPDIDVLKVGHHGSKTSSSKEFINEINPKYSIISVGKNNRYGHPNKEVLDNLKNSKIYRTDQDGSIMFKIKNNKLRIETCSP